MRGIVQLNRILVRRVFVFSVRRILLAYAFFLDAHILEVGLLVPLPSVQHWRGRRLTAPDPP